MVKKSCSCCGKKIDILASQKYCSRCSLHTKDLRKKINNARYRLSLIKKNNPDIYDKRRASIRT